MRWSRLWLGIVIAVMGCQRSAQVNKPLPPEVVVATPTVRSEPVYREYTGRLEAKELVQVRVRVRGTVERVAFEEGGWVQAGQLLYEIDPREYAAIVAQAQARVQQTRADFEQARREAERAEQLRLRGPAFISDEEYRAKITSRETKEAAWRQAEAELELAKLNLSFTRITAPISGRISRTLVTPGNLVGFQEPTLLTTIVRMDPLYVVFYIPERDWLVWREAYRTGGQSPPEAPLAIALENETGYPHRGVIRFEDNRFDASTGTILLRGEIPNPQGRLLPGLFCRVQLPLRPAEPRVFVQEKALAADFQGRYVLIVNEEGQVAMRRVRVGTTRDGWALIEEGLQGTEQVIVEGQQFARPGFPVRVRKDSTDSHP